VTDRRTDRQTDGQTDRQADGIAIAYMRYSYAVARKKESISSNLYYFNQANALIIK